MKGKLMSIESFSQKPRGTRDILPEDQPYWQFVLSCAKNVVSGLGFSQIDTPLYEDKRLFERGVGEGTDIVEKEMFLIDQINTADDDSGDVQYALRPEGTAGAARAYVENGMNSWPQPVRLFYFGPMFRRERPQKGRYREHRQFGVEIFGDSSPKSDYLSIMSAYEILQKLGFSDLSVTINSIGCAECRPKYLASLKKYYKNKLSKLCDDCRRRYSPRPLRLLDCKNNDCKDIAAGAPQILDNLCSPCRSHFQQTLEYLDDFGIKFNLDATLVRGLDYYTRTVFEISTSGDSERSFTLAGGGRYDNLIELLGGSKTPAVGWGMGIDRVVSELKNRKTKMTKTRGVEVVILELGKTAKKVCKKIYTDFRKEDVNVFYIPSNDSLSAQLKMASKLGADYAVIVGQKEAQSNSVIIRDLKQSTQEDMSVAKALEEIKGKYNSQNPNYRTCC